MNEFDRCIICTCDTSEVKLKKCFHIVNNYIFFTKAKCYYLMCDECNEQCEQFYGDNYCPLCRNNHKINRTNNTIIHQFVSFSNESPINMNGNSGFIVDILQENMIIKLFSNKIMFECMTKLELICYFFFTIWFAYTVMLPTFFMLFICLFFGMVNKYIAHTFTIITVVVLNYFLIKCVIMLCICTFYSLKNFTFEDFHGCY